MERHNRPHHHLGGSGILIGGLIVTIGLFLLLDNMGIVRVHDVWRFWPVILVVYGVSRILEAHAPAGYLWGGVVALAGALILLDNLDILIFNFDLIWPFLIIAFGLSMLLRAMDRKKYTDGAPVTSDSTLNVVAIFGGSKRRVDTEDFRGADVSAVFGGVHLDLRHAKMTVDRAVVDVNAIFGGVEIRVPENWSVMMKGASVFGGFEDKTVHPKTDPDVPTRQLVITGASVFGGMSVEN
jgi:predicted membrane protein